MKFICQYCNKGYTRESTLIVHVCEQKRRALAQHEKHVVIAFDAYQKFYKLTQNSKQPKTYAEFCKSPYYTAFIKFGSYVSNVKPLYQDNFIDYIIRSGIKLDHWCRDEVYDKYVVELIRKESVDTALQRSISHMISWADSHNQPWNSYFTNVSLSRASFDIKDGKISPWLILNCNTGKDMLRKMTDEQLTAINATIDPQFWLIKFKRQQADIQFVHQVVQEAHL